MPLTQLIQSVELFLFLLHVIFVNEASFGGVDYANKSYTSP